MKSTSQTKGMCINKRFTMAKHRDRTESPPNLHSLPPVRRLLSCFLAETTQKRIVVAIDGPAGAGKSTIAKGLAARPGVYLYRYRCHVPRCGDVGGAPGGGPRRHAPHGAACPRGRHRSLPPPHRSEEHT